MNAANEGLQLEQANLARGLGAKRKSTTAVSKEVACLLNSSLDSCSSQQDPPRCSERRRGKEGTIMAVITAFLIALSFSHFMSLKSTLIFCFNAECLEICFEVHHFHLTQPLDSIDIRQQQAV